MLQRLLTYYQFHCVHQFCCIWSSFLDKKNNCLWYEYSQVSLGWTPSGPSPTVQLREVSSLYRVTCLQKIHASFTYSKQLLNWNIVTGKLSSFSHNYVQSNFLSKRTFMASWSKSITVYSLQAKARLQNIIQTFCNFLLRGTLGILGGDVLLGSWNP